MVGPLGPSAPSTPEKSLWAPIQLEYFLFQKEKALVRYLASKVKLDMAILISFLVGALLIWNADLFSPSHNYRINGGYGVVRLIRFSVGWLVLLSPLTIWSESQKRIRVHFLILLFVWAIVTRSYFATSENNLLLLAVYLCLPAQLLISYNFLKRERKLSKAASLGIYSAIFLSIEGGISYAIWKNASETKAFLFWNLKSQFIYFTTVSAFYFSKNRPHYAKNLLVPVNCLIGFIWPISTRLCENERGKKLELWTHGMMNIALGYSVIGIRIAYELLVENKGQTALFHQLGYYVLAVLAIVGHLNILVGVARLYGMVVPDATHFVWLARSPAEYWRRGVFYQYLFIKNFITLGLYRRIKLMFLTIVICFAFFLIKKIGLANYVLFVDQFLGLNFFESEFDHTHRELYALLQWTLWLILLFASPYLFSRTRLFESKLYAWTSIVSTHLLMASTYYFAAILKQVVLGVAPIW